MKRIKSIFNVLLCSAALFAAAAATSCQSDPAEVSRQVEVDNTTIRLNKKGLNDRGQSPSISITSEVYWSVNIPEGNEWIRPSVMGGSGYQTITLTADEYAGEVSRSGQIFIETVYGLSLPIDVIQTGTQEYVTYIAETGGELPVSSDTEVRPYRGWSAAGISSGRLYYTGTQTYVSSQFPSEGYAAASGGNNVYFAASDAIFTIPDMNTHGDTKYKLSFGYYRPAVSGTEPLTIHISDDNTNWQRIEWPTDGLTEGWNWIEYEFTVIPGTAAYSLRFTAAQEGLRIDDFSIIEGSGAGPMIDFTDFDDGEFAGLPVEWSFPYANITDAEAAGAFNRNSYLYRSDDMAAALQVFRAVDPSTANNVYMRYSATPGDTYTLMYGMAHDDYWKITVPVRNFTAGNITLSTAVSSSGSGPKFYILEYSTDDANWTAVNARTGSFSLTAADPATRDVTYTYVLPDSPANAEVAINEVIEIPTNIDRGNIYLRLRVPDPMAANRARDNAPAHNGTTRIRTSIRVDLGGTVAPDPTGLPANWSFPETLPDGYFNAAERYLLSDDGLARMSVTVGSENNTTLGNPTYGSDGSAPDTRFHIAGMYVDDAFNIAVPVTNFEPGTINLKTRISASAKGQKYWRIEYSTDGTTWNYVNTKRRMLAWANGSNPREVDYTFGLADSPAHTAFDINQNIDIPVAIADGTIQIRIVAASSISTDGTRDNNLPSPNGGTCRIRNHINVKSGADPAGEAPDNDLELPAEPGNMTGLPATWSFPYASIGAAEAAGAFDRDAYWYRSDDMAATLQVFRAVNPSTAANVYMRYAAAAEIYTLMYGMTQDDYWKLTIPVTNFTAGNITLNTAVSSSGSGPKFYILEYSTDDVNWTGVNTRTESYSLTAADPATRDVTFTYVMPDSPANAEVSINQVIAIPTNIDNGNIYLRLRVPDPMAANRARDNAPAHNGTTRIRNSISVVAGGTL